VQASLLPSVTPRPLALPVRVKERKSPDREGTPVAAKIRQVSEEREVSSEAWGIDGEEAKHVGGKGQVTGEGRDVGAEEETFTGGDGRTNDGRVGFMSAVGKIIAHEILAALVG